MSHTQRSMMIRFGQFARNANYFTSSGKGQLGLSPKVAQRNLDELEQAGLIMQIKTGYKLTQAGRNHIDGPGRLVDSTYYGNHSTTEPYKLPKWHVREGAEEFLIIKSLGPI